MKIKIVKVLLPFLLLCTVVIVTLALSLYKKASEVATTDSGTNQAEGILVKDHLRHAEAYRLIMGIQKERISRPMSMKMLFVLDNYAEPGHNLNPAIVALDLAIVARDQDQAKAAVDFTRKTLANYGKKLGKMVDPLLEAEVNKAAVSTQKCSADDEAILHKLRDNFTSSFEKLSENGDPDTAEKAFIDGWLAMCASYLIGPDYVAKKGDVGRKEIFAVVVDLKSLGKKLSELGKTKSGDDRTRLQNQSKLIFLKTKSLENLLPRMAG